MADRIGLLGSVGVALESTWGVPVDATTYLDVAQADVRQESAVVDTVVVYKANTESLQVVLGLLRKEGFNPTTLEDPAMVPVRGASRHVVHVAVPRDEAPGARSVLRKWDQAQQSQIGKMTSKLAGPFLCSAAIVAALAVIFLFFGILLDGVALLFVIWIVLFALMANAEKLSRRLKRQDNQKTGKG